jgi:hypothetical protein
VGYEVKARGNPHDRPAVAHGAWGLRSPIGELEVFACEGATRMRFQVFLKGNRFGVISVRDRGLDLPWSGFGCVGHSTGIVSLETAFQVVGYSDVVSIRSGCTLQYINVGERNHSWLAGA